MANATGAAGVTGSAGTLGIAGTGAGTAGTSGAAGSLGAAGNIGIAGVNGAAGSRGIVPPVTGGCACDVVETRTPFSLVVVLVLGGLAMAGARPRRRRFALGRRRESTQRSEET
jgi:hypothetical protein